MSACHAGDPGSIPGECTLFFFNLFFFFLLLLAGLETHFTVTANACGVELLY
jgi:hypothetical protein